MKIPERIDATRCAILAMDFQRSILGFLPDPSELLAKTRTAIDTVRHGGGRACYVRVGFETAELSTFPAYSAMGARVRAAGANMLADSNMTAVVDELTPHPNDIVVRKTRVGTFSTTDLHEQLKRSNIETLILTGVHTSGVVLSTVREAHDLDYRIFVLADACADPDKEVHDFLVGRIFPKQATVCNASELSGMLTRRLLTRKVRAGAPASSHF